MLTTILVALLIGAFIALVYQRGVIRGMMLDNDGHTRSWNDGFAKARDFYETPVGYGPKAEPPTHPFPQTPPV